MATTTKKTVSETAEKVVEEKVKVRTFKNTDLIPCRSICNGGLLVEGPKTGTLYKWADYNDIELVEYQDLAFMIRQHHTAIRIPRLIIEDQDILSQNADLVELYNSLYSTKDLREIISLPTAQMKQMIATLPPAVAETLKGLVSTMIEHKQLDSVEKIKTLDEIFGTTLLLTLAQY